MINVLNLSRGIEEPKRVIAFSFLTSITARFWKSYGSAQRSHPWDPHNAFISTSDSEKLWLGPFDRELAYTLTRRIVKHWWSSDHQVIVGRGGDPVDQFVMI